jgi:hypothetical protein
MPTSAFTNLWVDVASSADGNNLVAAIDGGTVYVSANAGSTWQPTSAPTNYYQAVTISGDGTVLAAAVSGGPIVVSTNSGADWFQSGAPSQLWKSVASSADGTRLVAVAAWNVWTSTNSGNDWAMNSPVVGPLSSVACSADGTKLAAAIFGGELNGVPVGGIATSTNAGLTWTRANVPVGIWQCVSSSGDGVKLAAGAALGGQVYTSQNSGITWNPTVLPSDNWYSMASSFDGGTMLAATATGQIYCSTDSGATWISNSVPAGTIPGVHATSVASSADGTRLVAAVYGGGIYTAQATAPSAETLPACGTNSDAVLNALVNPNGWASTAWFEWGTSASYGHKTVAVSIGNGDLSVPLHASLSGLRPGVAYHYRVQATNSFGIAIGQNGVFQAPRISLNGSDKITNYCCTPFVDAGGTATAAPLAIAAGWYFSSALRSDGSVITWGDNSCGQTNVAPDATNVVSIAGGWNHELALKADGTVTGWGLDYQGQVSATAGWSNIVAIAAGWTHSQALQSDGTIADSPDLVSNVVAVAAGNYYSLALRRDGTVFGWGYDGPGELDVLPGWSNVVAISARYFNILALKTDGTVLAWGLTPPEGLSNVTAIASGFSFGTALLADSSVVGWGDQYDLPSNLNHAVAIAAGGYHGLAIKDDGSVVAWGESNYGQIDIPEAVTNLPINLTETGRVDTNTPGTYVLTYSATNALGGVGRITRRVVVVGAREMKEQVLAAMKALMPLKQTRNALPLRKAIESLARSLAPGLWVDETHLVANRGNVVFLRDAEALSILVGPKWRRLPEFDEDTVQSWAQSIVSADRILADVEIAAAADRGASSRQIEAARSELIAGDHAVATRNYTMAIRKYMNAWKLLTSGSSR